METEYPIVFDEITNVVKFGYFSGGSFENDLKWFEFALNNGTRYLNNCVDKKTRYLIDSIIVDHTNLIFSFRFNHRECIYDLGYYEWSCFDTFYLKLSDKQIQDFKDGILNKSIMKFIEMLESKKIELEKRYEQREQEIREEKIYKKAIENGENNCLSNDEEKTQLNIKEPVLKQIYSVYSLLDELDETDKIYYKELLDSLIDTYNSKVDELIRTKKIFDRFLITSEIIPQIYEIESKVNQLIKEKEEIDSRYNEANLIKDSIKTLRK